MQETERKVGTRTTDPELMAMSRIDKILAGLPGTAAARVLGWLSAKYTWPEPRDEHGQPAAGDASYRRGLQNDKETHAL